MAFRNSADVHCYIDIIPYEGPVYSFTTDTSSKKSYSGILSCTVEKNIRNPASGTFTIILSPGGPKGVKAWPSWTEVITPMSFTTIGMRRGDDAAIVMIGVVTNVQETQSWSDKSVSRTITITGHDFSYFFTMRNYYNLNFIGSPAITALNPSASNSNAFLASIDPNLIYGTPDLIANTWFQKMMIPLINLSFYIKADNTYVNFQDLVSYYFAEYDASSLIPFGTNFLSTQSSWFEKFMSFFPFPYYECFVQTVSNSVLNTIMLQSGQESNYSYSSNNVITSVAGFNFLNTQSGGSSIGLIGRILPFPYTKTGGGTNQQPASVNTSYWDGLMISNSFFDYLPPNDSFISSSVSFKADEISNFYTILPTQFAATFGIAPSVTMATIAFPFAGDVYSIDRFGWKPNISTIEWFYTSENTNTQVKNTNDWASLGYDLLGRLTSYYEPIPVMAYATYQHVLMPSVFPGTRFQYKPFRSEDPYVGQSGIFDFYVEGVSHSFNFGGQSSTTLTLSRGVPKEIWGSPSNSLLLLTGQLGRVAGTYYPYSPPKTQQRNFLKYYTYDQAKKLADNISTVFQNKKP